MGDRASISFSFNGENSVTLFTHWGGMEFVQEATAYARRLKKEAVKEGGSKPLYRLEPATVMVDFIRHYTHNFERVDSNLYIGKDEDDGDNSDNGHHIIEL